MIELKDMEGLVQTPHRPSQQKILVKILQDVARFWNVRLIRQDLNKILIKTGKIMQEFGISCPMILQDLT